MRIEAGGMPGAVVHHAATSPLAGHPPSKEMLIDIAQLEHEYYECLPDVDDPSQLVSFGSSGHRGSPMRGSFTESHVLAIAQAICDFRRDRGIDGPLYIGKDTHALSGPAQRTVLSVLVPNGVESVIQRDDAATPAPAVSRAIVEYNQIRKGYFADGIAIGPSHQPPDCGRIKYHSPKGGPADCATNRWLEARANILLRNNNREVKRMPYLGALRAVNAYQEDFLMPYVRILGSVIDMDAIRTMRVKLGVDPLAGASRQYWEQIASIYGLQMEIIGPEADPTFGFMPVDHDGKIRMDCSSPFAMARLIDRKDHFLVAFANDPDAGRYGIVTPSAGLMDANHFLAAAVRYLLTHRPRWPLSAAVGKSLVCTNMIDRVVRSLERRLIEVPTGFSWLVRGLSDGCFCFGAEENGGASFLRRDGATWNTTSDGMIMSLLAAEMTARTGKDPGEHYRELTAQFGSPVYARIDVRATPEQRAALRSLSPSKIQETALAGQPILAKLTCIPGTDTSIGGLKVISSRGWFAARPCRSESFYRIYAESFECPAHLLEIATDAQAIVSNALNGDHEPRD
jgi:phosphoglucomutase